MTDLTTVEIPADVFARLVKVAMHVSAGRSFAFEGQGPYPDATARRALGALYEAGLIPAALTQPNAAEQGQQQEVARSCTCGPPPGAICVHDLT